MNYESMSDFEINKAVATAWLPCDYDFDDKAETVDLVGYTTYLGAHGIPDERLEKYGEFNPCNNPTDAWPIILENGIAPLAENGRIYGATTNTYEYYEPRGNVIYSCEDKNPLRAAMIVFLMMSES